MRNIGSRIDKAGMCVTTSQTVAADWAGLRDWSGYRDWAAGFRGGSIPSRNIQQIAEYAKHKGIEPAPYVQYVGQDPAPLLRLILGSGRMASVTWHDSHMLNCVHFDGKWAGILDNNGDPSRVQWYPAEEAVRRIKGRHYAWVHCWVAPGPPPPPRRSPRAPLIPTPTVGQAGRAAAAPSLETFPAAGVLWGSAAEQTTGYVLSGRQATWEEVQAALGGEGFARRPHLTVIGPPEACEPVRQDLASPDLAAFRDRYRVQFYGPSDWAVQAGHQTTGLPTIYVQAPDGTVLHRTDRYLGAAHLVQALRRADPSYDPSSDPDLVAPVAPLEPAPEEPLAPEEGSLLGLEPAWGWACLAVPFVLTVLAIFLLAILLWRRRR
jgi:hypothetical protein